MRRTPVKKNKLIGLFAACIVSFLFLVVSKHLGLSWVEISGMFIAILSFAIAVWQGLKSISDSEQESIESVKKELIKQIETIRRDTAEKDRSHDKDLDFIKQQTTLINLAIQEQNRINSELSQIYRDIEQLSAALAQNSKYTELLKRQSNIEKLLKSEKTKSFQLLTELLERMDKIEKGVISRNI